MKIVKLKLSFDSQTAELVQTRAREVGKPVDRYLSDLVAADAQGAKDHLAAEGYSALSTDASAFAEASFPLAMNIWPVWCETGEARLG